MRSRLIRRYEREIGSIATLAGAAQIWVNGAVRPVLRAGLEAHLATGYRD